jgi:glycine dehydrogenase
MITYPSAHGVFEESFCQICQIIHDHGGQVYLDGANFNALVGVSRPGKIGADVAHLNLHKTFSIPHGGGPGVGPIGVGEHLIRFLPTHPVLSGVNPAATKQTSIGTISAAPWGSANILSIPLGLYRYDGCSRSKKSHSNGHIKCKLYCQKASTPLSHFLYTGKNSWIAHECIIDCRAFKKSCGVSVNDIAKRLIDYGYHALTVSFPVHETLMIEPTESENKPELDKFCGALICIRQEIAAIENGSADRQDNPLVNAPHTQASLIADNWSHPYSRIMKCGFRTGDKAPMAYVELVDRPELEDESED